MELFIPRFDLTPRSSVGHLFVGSTDRKPHCFTIEDAVREVAGRPVNEWKILGRTAIPVGRYEVAINWSNRFNRRMPLLMGVPGFDGIRIHVANTDLDVEGCIGVGDTHERKDFIGHSAQVFGLFFLELDAWLRNEKVFITISNPPPELPSAR